MLSKACYAIGAVVLVLFGGLLRFWFPPHRTVVAAIECHGEVAQVEAYNPRSENSVLIP